VRSKYFNGNKIFLDTFWEHLSQKHPVQQIRRLRFYKCAIDLLKNSLVEPTIIYGYEKDHLLYRFNGRTKSGEGFYVQVKQNKRTGRKDFMSVFGAEK
jgi:hypothetical protein